MAKGILVIDKIPEYCDEHCKFCDSFFNCQYVGDIEEAWRNKQRDSKCPIKPLPKQAICYPTQQEPYWDGWNDCLEQILGEENG